MTDKQIIIDDVDVSGCEFYWKERGLCNNGNLTSDCQENKDCIYKKYKAKEQECERLKEEVEDFQIVKDHMKYQGFETLSEFLLSETVANECNKQLDQLKQILTEIKEIAEKNLNIHTCAFKGCGYDLITKQILQKISEWEVE